MLWGIMLFLDLEDLGSVILTNKVFYKIQQNDNFWKENFQSRFKFGYPSTFEKQRKTWKEKYFYFLETLCLSMHLIKKHLADKSFVIECIKLGLCLVYNIDEELQNDRDVVLTEVKRNGLHLLSLVHELRNDKEIVLAAVKQYSYSLEYASKELKNDKEFVLKILKSVPVTNIPCLLDDIDRRLQTDQEVLLEAIKINTRSFLRIRKSIRRDKSFVLKAVQVNGLVLEVVCSKFKNDKEIVLAAIKQNIVSILYSSVWLSPKILTYQCLCIIIPLYYTLIFFVYFLIICFFLMKQLWKNKCACILPLVIIVTLVVLIIF